MHYHLAYAETADLPVLAAIINQSYRGETSKFGWTSEAYFIEGEKRTDEDDLLVHLQNKNAVLLKAVNEQKIADGCVYLEKRGEKLYLGMLSVKPVSQRNGIGKFLMKAAESYALEHNIFVITMNVISLRTELILWYQQQGYKDTGQRTPFPDIPEYGKPILPLEFIIMEKRLQPQSYT